VYRRHLLICELLEDVLADLAASSFGQLGFTDSNRVVWTKPRQHGVTCFTVLGHVYR